jgi:hypothetical protein
VQHLGRTESLLWRDGVEPARFDSLSRLLARAESRRSALKILASGVLAGVVSGFSHAATSAQTTCPPGTYVNGSNCTPCAIGTFSSTANGPICTPCPRGSFNYQTGQPACTPCPPNTFAANTGSIGCQPCPFGQTSPAGSSSCSPRA